MSLRALLRQSGEVSGAITCVLDVTDSARARQRARAARHLRHAHRLPQPLLDPRRARRRELEREGSSGHRRRLRRPRRVQARQRHARPRRRRRAARARRRAPAPGQPRHATWSGRLGGDEFLVVLHDIPGPDVAMTVAERDLRPALGGLRALRAAPCGCAAASAWRAATARRSSAEELVKQADAAMYASKERRRGQPVLAPSPCARRRRATAERRRGSRPRQAPRAPGLGQPLEALVELDLERVQRERHHVVVPDEHRDLDQGTLVEALGQRAARSPRRCLRRSCSSSAARSRAASCARPVPAACGPSRDPHDLLAIHARAASAMRTC